MGRGHSVSTFLQQDQEHTVVRLLIRLAGSPETPNTYKNALFNILVRPKIAVLQLY